MTKNRAFLLLTLLAFLTLTGCTGAMRLAKYRATPLPRLEQNFHVQEIVILDKRINASNQEMELPFFSFPNMYSKHVPELTGEHKNLFETLIRENTTGTGQSVKGVIIIEEAYKEFSATWASEKERGFAKLKVAFYSSETNQLVAEATASGDFFLKSIHATTPKMEKVYQLALRNVLYECLKLISQQSNK